MFRHLRNRLIIINLAVTTAVLLLAFSSIYLVARETTYRRQILRTEYITDSETQYLEQTINKRIQSERNQALSSLLASLFIVGVSVEFAVAVLSYILAEAAIRPVKEAYDAQKMFIANASHEMKTPIAAIMANLEVADIQDNQCIDNVSHEAKYMADLNRQLLDLARAENAMTVTKTADTVVLKDFVEELLSPFQPRMQTQKIHYEFRTKLKAGKIKIVKSDFAQIVSILMDNAVKYCDKQIIVTLTGKSLSIENDGATIPADKLARIFDRFYQTSKSAVGVGLGLSIAKTVANHQGWKLAVTSDDKTTTFTLTF